jgi:glycosyltransferase involved in cell wall biosynthesis
MRIGIDARFYGTLGKGLGRYTAELIRGLEALETSHEFVVYVRPENEHEYIPGKSNFHKVVVDLPWYGVREQLWWPWFLGGQRLDLMHFPHFNVPILCPVPFVVTIHDLILLRYPTVEATTHTPLVYWAKHYAYRLALWVALRRAQSVITVSRFVADDIRTRFPFLSQSIAITHEAAYQSGVAVDSGGLREPAGYMTLGNAYPHKNLEWLAGFFSTRTEDLTLVGKMDVFRSALREHFSDQSNLVFSGELSDTKVIQKTPIKSGAHPPVAVRGFWPPAPRGTGTGHTSTGQFRHVAPRGGWHGGGVFPISHTRVALS